MNVFDAWMRFQIRTISKIHTAERTSLNADVLFPNFVVQIWIKIHIEGVSYAFRSKAYSPAHIVVLGIFRLASMKIEFQIGMLVLAFFQNIVIIFKTIVAVLVRNEIESRNDVAFAHQCVFYVLLNVCDIVNSLLNLFE